MASGMSADVLGNSSIIRAEHGGGVTDDNSYIPGSRTATPAGIFG